jgi:sulfur relay (sulfurtransferase) DsrF/TusC family protein
MEKKLRFFEEEILEVRTHCSLQITESKLDSVKLKGQMRVLCTNHNVLDIYNIFDIHTQKLIVENESLREKNLILESKKIDNFLSKQNLSLSMTSKNKEKNDEKRGKTSDIFEDLHIDDNNDNNFELDLTAIEIKKNAKLCSKFNAILNENINLKKNLDDMYGKERQYVLSQKLARDASRRLVYVYI